MSRRELARRLDVRAGVAGRRAAVRRGLRRGDGRGRRRSAGPPRRHDPRHRRAAAERSPDALAGRLVLDVARRGPARPRGVGRIAEARYQPDAGDVDVDASAEAIVEARAARAGVDPERLRVRRWVQPRTAVCLLVDRSGSMGGRPLATSAVAAAAVAFRAPDDFSVVSFARDAVVVKAQDATVPAETVVDGVLALRGHGTTDLAGALAAARRAARPVVGRAQGDDPAVGLPGHRARRRGRRRGRARRAGDRGARRRRRRSHHPRRRRRRRPHDRDRPDRRRRGPDAGSCSDVPQSGRDSSPTGDLGGIVPEAGDEIPPRSRVSTGRRGAGRCRTCSRRAPGAAARRWTPARRSSRSTVAVGGASALGRGTPDVVGSSTCTGASASDVSPRNMASTACMLSPSMRGSSTDGAVDRSGRRPRSGTSGSTRLDVVQHAGELHQLGRRQLARR